LKAQDDESIFLAPTPNSWHKFSGNFKTNGLDELQESSEAKNTKIESKGPKALAKKYSKLQLNFTAYTTPKNNNK